MLELAREHALERIQFGRPIATLPGRPSPAGRDPRRHSRGRRRPARRRLGRPLPRDAAAMAKAVGRAGPPGSPPATANRCWPASASPPSTRCTSTCGARSCSTGCSALRCHSPRSSASRSCATPGSHRYWRSDLSRTNPATCRDRYPDFGSARARPNVRRSQAPMCSWAAAAAGKSKLMKPWGWPA